MLDCQLQRDLINLKSNLMFRINRCESGNYYVPSFLIVVWKRNIEDDLSCLYRGDLNNSVPAK